MNNLRQMLDDAVPRLGDCTVAAVLHASDLLKRNGFTSLDEPKDWSDADKLRVLALTLYMDDWEKEVYDQDDVQRDLIRIADNLDVIEDFLHEQSERSGP